MAEYDPYKGRIQSEKMKKELEQEKNGFEVLMETKRDLIVKVYNLMQANPKITRAEIAKELGISVRSVSRYTAVLRQRYKKGVILSQFDRVLIQKKENIKRLKELMKKEPNLSKRTMSKKMGISKRTLNTYLEEIYSEGK